MTNKDIAAKLAGEPNKTKSITVSDINNLLANVGNTEGGPGALGSFVAPEGQYKGTLSGQGVFDQYAPVDLQDLQARQQTTGEKWQNGAIKFGSQVGTGVIGNIANLFYGTGAAIVNQDFNKWFDNDFTQALDSWDDSMRENYQNFKTTEQQNRAWYQNILGDGGANFWADDFLGGMAFTVSAVLSEIALTAATTATFGATSGLQAGMTARILARGARMLDKGGDATRAISGIAGARKAINIGNKVDKGLLFTRRLATGAGYEAGVEARGFKDEAWGEKLREIGIGSKEELQQSNPELFASTEEAINNASNYVFAGNMALVGASNFVTLPKTFGKGLFKSGAINKKILSPTKVGGKEGAYTVAYDNWSKARKIGYTTRKLAERPLTEGLFEEGGQGFVKQTGLEYISKKYSSEGVSNNYDLVDALGDAFGETYGSSIDNEFWKEVGIGMIIGSLGSPTFTSINLLEDGWQGSLAGAYRDIGKNIESAKKIIDVANKDKGLSKLAIMQKAANVSFESNKEMNAAYEKKDYFRGKNAESREFFNMVSNRYQLGVSDQMLEDTIAEVQAMEAEEFAETFGYEGNMTTEELESRKKEVVESATDNTNKAIKSIREAEKTIQDYNFVTEEGSLNSLELIEALAYNDYMVSDLDTREFKLSDEISKNLGIDARTLLDIRNENQSVRMTKKWIENFKGQHDELKAAEKELEDAEKSEESSDNIEILRKKVGRQKSRYYRAVKKEHAKRKETTNNGKKYDRDFESFKNVVEETIALQDKINGLYFDKPARKKNVESMLNDLNSMATQRKNYNEDTRTLLSIDGFKVFNKSLDELREAATKDARVNLLKSYKQTLGQSTTLDKAQIDEILEQLESEIKKTENDVTTEEIKTESKDEYINTVVNKLNEFIRDSKSINDFEIFQNYIKDAKENISEKLANIDEGTEASEAKKEEYNDVLNKIENTEKFVKGKLLILKEAEKSKNYKGFNNVLNSVNSFIRFINKDEEGQSINLEEVLKGKTWEQIQKGLRISVEPWEGADKLSNSKNEQGKDLGSPVQIQSGYVAKEGNFAIRLYVGDTLIGALTPPNKFIHEGKELDFSQIEDGKLLNEKFSPEEIGKLNYYRASYENLLQRSLKGDRIGYEELSQVVNFKLYLKELKYIPKGQGRKTVSQSNYKIKLGDQEGYLVINKLGNTTFVTEEGELILSSKSNRKLYSKSIAVLKKMSLSSAEIYDKANHSNFMVIPRGDDFGLIGLDYPAEEDNTMSDEVLQDTYTNAINDFNSWSDDKNDKNSKGSKKSIYDVPVTITVTRKGSTTPIGMDISLPLLRNKQKDGSWGPATLFGNAKVSGSTRNLYELFLGLNYDKDGKNLQIKLNSKFSEEFNVENLKKWINKKIHESIGKSKKNEATQDIINILTENGKYPVSNVSVANIYPKSISEFKGDLELASEPGSPAIIVQPSNTMDEVPDKFIPTTTTKETVQEELQQNKPEAKKEIPTSNTGISWDKTTKFIKTGSNSGINLPYVEGFEAFIESRGGSYIEFATLLDTSFGPAIMAKVKAEFINPAFTLEAFGEWAGKLIDEPTNNSGGGDVAFSTVSYKGDIIALDKIKSALAKILPDSIKIEEVSDIIDSLEANGEVFGVFMDNVIYLDANKATKGLAYHEAFHAVFRTLFTGKERTEILKLAEKEFGKPTKKNRDDLKALSGKYKTFSTDKLNELWLEERLADKFATHEPTKKSWFSRIFDKIKKWLNIAQDNSISSIFDRIYEGKFKNRFVNKTTTNNNPAFVMLKTDKNRTLSVAETEIILSKIYLKTLKDTSNLSTEDKIVAAIKEVKSQFNILKFGYNPRAQQKAGKLFFALTGNGLIKNEQTIIDTITSRLGTYNFTNKTLLEKEEDLEVDNETSERIFEDDLGNFRGIKSLSERIRNYITNTYYYSDFLGLGLSGEDLQQDDWKVSIEFDKVYDTLVRGLADIEPSNMLNRIYYLGKSNPQIELFFDKLITDIHSELNIKEEFSFDKKLDYRDSTLYNELVANFDNTKVNFMTVLFDATKGIYRTFNTNNKDIDEQQLSSWSNLFQNIRQGLNLKEVATKISTDLFEKYYPSEKQSIGTLFENLDSNIEYIQAFLASNLGLTLSKDYLKYSIIKDNLDSTETTEIDGTQVEESLKGLIQYYRDSGDGNLKEMEDLFNFYETFKDAGNSLDETIEGQNLLFGLIPKILNGSPENANPFSSKSDEIDAEGTVQSGKGAVTRFKSVARTNGIFDPTISSTTFRNNGGNLISDKVKNSFYTDMFKMFKKQEFKAFFKEMKEGNKTYEDWAELLGNNDIVYTDSFNKLYFQAIKNNPLITEENIEDLFSAKQNINIIGGMRETVLNKDGSVNTFKDFNEGKDFKNLTSLDKVLFSMISYTKTTTVEDKNYGLFTIEVNEAKNINYLLNLPINNYNAKQGPNQKFLDNYYKLFLTEYNIIKETKKGLDTTIKGFNDSEEGRGHKFFKFDFLSDELKEELINSKEITPQLEKDIINQLRGNTISLIKDFTSLIQEEKLVEKLPPQFFNEGKKTKGLDKNEIANFVLNDFMNSSSYSDLMNGSDMVGHKNLVDIVKRNGGKVAYGSSLGKGTTKIKVIPDYSIEGVHGTIDEAGDGQSYSTPMWRVNTYLKGLGKYRKELEGIYDDKTGIPLVDKILLGITLNKKEYGILANNNALFNSIKTVGRDAQTYWKTSVHTISRVDVSTLPKGSYEEAYSLLSLIKDKIKAGDDVKSLYTELHKLYTPKPHRVDMHNLLNEMEANGTDITAFESSIKTSSIENIEMSNRFIREQVNTDGFKNEIIDGTQLMQLIWSEQTPERDELVTLYKHFVKQRISEGYNILENTIFEKTPKGVITKPLYNKLFKEFKSTITSSLDDPYMAQLFELDAKGQPIYDPNFTAVVSKFESMFLSYVSKHAFKFKSKGRKYTLTANYGYKVKIDENDSVIPTGSNKKSTGSRYLKYDSNTGIAEVIISRYAVKDHLDLIEKNGGFIPAELAEQLGFRIPTQDNASIVKLKVVDLIDGAYGNTIIIPSEINEISGSDFDIDSLYAKIYNLTKEGTKFGSYIDIKNEGAAIGVALKELKGSKYIKDIIKDTVAEHNAEFRNALTIDSQGEEKLNIDSLLEDFINKSEELAKIVDNKYSQLGILNSLQFKKSKYYSNFARKREGDKWVEPLTREELENSMLDVQMQLSFNEFATETVEREPIEKVYAELLEEGIDLNDGITGVHDMVSKYKAFKANDAGKGGIGPMALYNTAYQVMRDANVKFTKEIKEVITDEDGLSRTVTKTVPLEMFPGKSSFTKDRTDDGERVNKLIASFITAYTDNNKHYDSERMGIDTNLVTSAAILFSTGVPLKDTITFMSQDAIQFWKNERNRGNWPKQEDILEYLESKASKFGFSKEAVNVAFKSEKVFDLNSENLIKSLKLAKNGYKGGESTNVEIDGVKVNSDLKAWVDINKSVMDYFNNLQTVSNEIRDFSKITALLKGVKKTTANIESVVESTKKLGVVVTKNDKLFKLDKVKTSVDWFKVINKSRYLEQNLINLAKIRTKVLNQFLISYTKGGRDLLDSTVKNTKTERYNKEDVYKKLLGDFNSYLQLKAYLHKGKGKLKYDFDGDLFNTDFFDKFGSVIGETVNPESDLYNNRLLTQLRKRHYTFQEGSVYEGKTITWGEVNTNTKRDADSTVELLEGFNNLLSSSNPDAKDLAHLIFKQTAIKDNFKFKNNSLIRLIELKYLKPNLLDFLPDIKNTLEKGSPEKYDELFGMGLSELRDEFIKLYSRNATNFKEVINIYEKPFKSISAEINVEGFNESGFEEDYTPASLEESLSNSLVTSTKNENGVTDALYFNAGINKNVKSNINRLKTLGLFNTSFDNKGKLRLEFPRVIKVAGTLYEINLPSDTFTDIYKGYKAEYKAVNSVGNSMISPYAFSLEQHDESFGEIKVREDDNSMMDSQAQKELQDLAAAYSQEGMDIMAMQGLGKSLEESSDLLTKWKKEGKGVSLYEFIAKEMGLDPNEETDGLNSVDLDLDYKVTYERIEDIKVVEAIADKLTKKFSKFVKGVVYTDKIPGKGMYQNGIVYINPNKVTKDTLFHEFAHPFVAAMREDNPKLYANLYKSLENSTEGSQIIAKINKAYNYKTKEMFMDEAIVTALGIDTATLKDKGLKSYIAQFWDKIRSYIKNLLNNPFAAVIVSQIDSNTSLKELSMIMLADNTIKRDLIASEAGNTYSKEVAFRKVNEINNKLNKKAVIAVAHMDGAYKIQSLVSENVIEIIKELEKCQ